jgi:hypothetical protein
MGVYALRRKNFRRKQFFTSEDAAKVRVSGKNSFDKSFFGEEEHNQIMFVVDCIFLLSKKKLPRSVYDAFFFLSTFLIISAKNFVFHLFVSASDETRVVTFSLL